jgi:hypothetical protein
MDDLDIFAFFEDNSLNETLEGDFALIEAEQEIVWEAEYTEVSSDPLDENLVSPEEYESYSIGDIIREDMKAAGIEPAINQNFDANNFEGVGNPHDGTETWDTQKGMNSCAVVTQKNILESITGEEYSEDKWCEIAESKGVYDPDGGTLPNHIGEMLKEAGQEVSEHSESSIEEMKDALSNGKKVMVGVDANEINYPSVDPITGKPFDHYLDAGHCVQVTAISDDNSHIYINDPGIEGGAMRAVSMEDFQNAWEDFGNNATFITPIKVG